MGDNKRRDQGGRLMEITIRTDPKDEKQFAIEYIRELVETGFIQDLENLGLHPTKYTVKYKINKGKMRQAKKKHGK
jgi:hypothetical protein